MVEHSNDRNILQKFGSRVRKLRLALGLSQEDLAELCELDRTYVSSVERGHRNISLMNITKLAVALKVKVADLFVDEDD